MILLMKKGFLIFFGLCSGMVVSCAVFAFITVLGIVPRMAQKTDTAKHVKTYETAIILGGIFGAITFVTDLYLPIGGAAVVAVSFMMGIFYGCLAMSLAETLNVIPILTRRARLQRGMAFFILAIALGKLVGSLVYYVIPGFIKI